PPLAPPGRAPPQQPIPRLAEAIDPCCAALRRGQRAEVTERRVGSVKLAPAGAGLARLRRGELFDPRAQRVQPLHVRGLESRSVPVGLPPVLAEALLCRGEAPCQRREGGPGGRGGRA